MNQQPSNNGERSGLPLYVGKWTREEEEYVDGLIENFRAGNIPGIADGTTLRYWLAGKLNCRVKRISKRYENTGYNGRAQYKDKEAGFAPQVYAKMTKKLQEQELAFLASRDQVMQGLAYARGSRRARAPRTSAAAAAAAAASRGMAVGPGAVHQQRQLLPPAAAVVSVTSEGGGGGVLPLLNNLESTLAASVRAASASLLPPSSLGRLTVGLVGGTQPTPSPPASNAAAAAAVTATLLGLGIPTPATATTSSSLAAAQAAAQAIAATNAINDPSVDLLLRATLIQKLSATAPAPAPDAPAGSAAAIVPIAAPAPAPATNATTQALIAVAAAAAQQQQSQSQPQSVAESSATIATSMVEALRLRQQIQQHQNRAAVLNRALQEHLVAAAMGNESSVTKS